MEMTINGKSEIGAWPTGRGIGVLGAVLCGVLAMAGWGLQARADLYQSGHGDVHVGYDPLPVGEWELGFHLEGAVVDGVSDVEGEFEAEDLAVLVPASTQSARPGGSEWHPIGAAAGETFWFLPQSGTLADAWGAPFLGIGAGEIGAGEFVGEQVSLTLVGVTGPGHFSMWQDGLAPTFYMSTADGVDAGDVFTVAAGSHDHVNYGFTAPGTYQVTLQASGVHVVDGAVAGNPTAFTFHVIPEPGSLGLAVAGIGLLAFTRKARRRQH
jgi:surface-anchored protein